jgi:hypothetical protein
VIVHPDVPALTVAALALDGHIAGTAASTANAQDASRSGATVSVSRACVAVTPPGRGETTDHLIRRRRRSGGLAGVGASLRLEGDSWSTTPPSQADGEAPLDGPWTCSPAVVTQKGTGHYTPVEPLKVEAACPLPEQREHAAPEKPRRTREPPHLVVGTEVEPAGDEEQLGRIVAAASNALLGALHFRNFGSTEREFEPRRPDIARDGVV